MGMWLGCCCFAPVLVPTAGMAVWCFCWCPFSFRGLRVEPQPELYFFPLFCLFDWCSIRFAPIREAEHPSVAALFASYLSPTSPPRDGMSPGHGSLTHCPVHLPVFSPNGSTW